jgi:hypothetical protein
LEELGHPQPPTAIQTDNECANGIANDTVKQRRSKAMDMRFYWIRNRIHHAYSSQQNMQRPCGSIIDKGENGRLSASDVVVLAETLLTADVSGIAVNTLQKVQMLHLYEHNMFPSLVSSINMHTMALVRLITLFPSCMILAP